MENLEQLVKKWESALESYGTSRDFADNTEIYLLGNPENPLDIPIRVHIAHGYAQRKELMDKQRKESEERKARNLPLRWANDGNPCFLCDNVGQAGDLGNNLILPFDTFEDYVLMPNKYPIMRGHSLLCAKEHNKDKSGITPIYLETLIKVSELYNFLVTRNHSRSGMSIPSHEHSHLDPSLVNLNSGSSVYLNGLADSELESTEYGDGIFSVKQAQFDILAINGKNMVEHLFTLTHNLENRDEIFTFCYQPKTRKNDSTFFLTVHKKEDDAKVRSIPGAGKLVHHRVMQSLEEISYKDHNELAKEYLYEKGVFHWQDYFKT